MIEDQANPQNQASLSEVTSVEPHQKQKQILVIGLVVLTLLLLVLTGCLAFQNSQLKKKLETETANNPARPEDSSDRFKTYENSKYGFSFEYPIDFYLLEWPQDDGTFGLTVTDQEDYASPLSLGNKKMAISISVGKADFARKDFYFGGYQWTKSVLDDLLDSPIGTEKGHKFDINTKISNVMGENYVGITYKSIPKDNTQTEGAPLLNAALEKNDTTILISAQVGFEPSLVFSKPYTDTFNQILSTLQFSD